MTDNDNESEYSNRQHSPIARLEKSLSVLRNETRLDVKELKKENEELRLWKVAHDQKAESESIRLSETRSTLYDRDGVCEKVKTLELSHDSEKSKVKSINADLYDVDGICNKVRDFETTKRNIYGTIVLVTLILTAIFYWTKI